MNWRAELSNPLRYEELLERMHARYAGTRRLETLTHDGVKLAELMYDKRRVAKMVARAVGEGSYELSPAQARFVQLKDRKRELFYFEALDFLVHGVVGEVIAESIEPMLSRNLYSYRRKFSSWHAVRRFAAEVRAHARGKAPRERGLYVLRADVRKYAETVPVGDRSLIWEPLRQALALDATDPMWQFVRRIVRPDLVDDEGAPSLRWRGLPLGSPVATILLNWYLHPLDQAMDALGGAFYLRFGDDILLAHVDPQVVMRAGATMEAIVADRLLAFNAKKKKLYYFNGAGRPSASLPEAIGSSEVVFLGCRIAFDGTVSLPAAKWRELLADIRDRITQTKALLTDASAEDRAAALCAVVNEALDPTSDLATKHSVLVRKLVTDRKQLQELDRLIAQSIAEAATGRSGPRAFRKMPPRALRETHHLASLVALRNSD